MSLKNLQDLMTKEKRKREMIKATQNFVAGMSAAVAMTVAAAILVAVRMGKEDKNMKANSDIAVTIKDTVKKKAASIKDSAVHQKNEAEHVIKGFHSKVDEIKEDIKNEKIE